jgi:hypothetical protein
MTDKQLEVILELVTDKFDSCKDIDEVKATVKEVKKLQRRMQTHPPLLFPY